MSLSRKLIIGVAAMALPLGSITVFGATSAFAGKPPPVNATGTVTCTGVSGQVKFGSPLTATGPTTGPNTDSVKLVLSNCTASGSNVTGTGTGKAKGTITTNGGTACTGLSGVNSATGSLTVKWSGFSGPGGAKVNTSTVSLTQIDGETSGTSNGNPGFAYGAQAASPTAPSTTTGSFASASGSGEVDTGTPLATLLSACTAKKGIKKLALVAGSTTS